MSKLHGRVCVVGGGPSGLAAAIALSDEHWDVTVVDCAVPPVDKACGEGLLPESLPALKALGIELPPEAGFPFHGIRFVDAHSSVNADFPHGAARGLRRTVLHRLLSDRAARLGVSLLWNAKHLRLTHGGVSLDERFIPADLVIGADGQNSTIRRQARLDQPQHGPRRYGFRCHYRIAPWSPYMEFYWGVKSQLYITPIAPGEICVAVVSCDPRLRLQRALDEFPEVHSRLRNATPVSAELGAVSVSRTLRRVHRGNLTVGPAVALVGDASGSVDAITGEGISLAIRQAVALAEAVRENDLRSYQRAHRRLMKRPRTMAALMLALERNEWLQRRALAGLARHPEIFETLLAIHVGASSFLDLCSWRLMDFSRAFLAA